jgi:hypothetical protein
MYHLKVKYYFHFKIIYFINTIIFFSKDKITDKNITDKNV